jgi:hypothetical protein
MTHYLIQIEPVYNQIVGNYYMITNNINSANIFRHELLKYRNFIMQKNNNDEIAYWEFHERIYKITTKSHTHYNGICIALNVYKPLTFEKLLDIDWNLDTGNIENNIIKISYPNTVYYEYTNKKCKLQNFNIMCDYLEHELL